MCPDTRASAYVSVYDLVYSVCAILCIRYTSAQWMWSGSVSVQGLISKRRIAGQTDMNSRGEGAVRFRPDTHRGGEEGAAWEEPYMKWLGGGGCNPTPLYPPMVYYTPPQ